MDMLKGESFASQALLRWWLIMGFIAMPDLQASNDLSEYLTSPLLDSPDDDSLPPALSSANMSANILTSHEMTILVTRSKKSVHPLQPRRKANATGTHKNITSVCSRRCSHSASYVSHAIHHLPQSSPRRLGSQALVSSCIWSRGRQA